MDDLERLIFKGIAIALIVAAVIIIAIGVASGNNDLDLPIGKPRHGAALERPKTEAPTPDDPPAGAAPETPPTREPGGSTADEPIESPPVEVPDPVREVHWPGAELPLRARRVVFSVDHSYSNRYACGEHPYPGKWQGVFARLSNGLHPDELGHYPRWATLVKQFDAAVDALEEDVEVAALRWGSTTHYPSWAGYRQATPETKTALKRWIRGRGIAYEATDTGTLGLALAFASWPDADVVLVTDGAPTVSPAGACMQIAHEDEIDYALRVFRAAWTGQRVHCIGILPPYRREELPNARGEFVGPCGWAPHYKTGDDFRNFLRTVAAETGGRFMETH